MQLNQTASSIPVVAGALSSKKNFKCGKTGHLLKNCTSVSKPNRPNQCGYCGGPKTCGAKFCKALNNKCNKCKLFGHYNQCCAE